MSVSAPPLFFGGGGKNLILGCYWLRFKQFSSASYPRPDPSGIAVGGGGQESLISKNVLNAVFVRRKLNRF